MHLPLIKNITKVRSDGIFLHENRCEAMREESAERIEIKGLFSK